MIKRLVISLAAALLIAAVSCDRRPLEDPSELVQVKVDVNVRAITNVSTRTRYTNNPRIDELTKEKENQLNTDIMRVLVYNPQNDALVNQTFLTYSTTTEDGDQLFTGDLNISFGNFNFLVYNFDTPTTLVKGEYNEKEILAYTNRLPQSKINSILESKAEDFEDIDINYEPEHLMVARKNDVRISPHDEVIVIHTEAFSVIDTYYIQIHVEGMQYATTRATAVITGLSPSNSIGLGLRTEEPSAAVCFDLKQSTDDTIPGENKDVLCAVFNTFGKIKDVSSDLHVTFNVFDVSGRLQQKDVNLDEIFKSDDAVNNHWLIINETWVLEKPEGPVSTSGGFQPLVNDWEEVEGNIAL